MGNKKLVLYLGQTTVKVGKIHKDLGFSTIIIQLFYKGINGFSVLMEDLYKCIIYAKHVKVGNTN